MINLNDYEFADRATFECGQCFRWVEYEDGYVGIAGKKVCKISDGILACPDEDNDFWREYFCLDMDYQAMKDELLERDATLKGCMDYGLGIRILKQDLWETVVSFIISANNNIPRIRKIVEGLCQSFGERVEFEGKTYYTFPTPQRLAELSVEDLAHLKAGYIDKYILDAAHKFANGKISYESLLKMPTDEARKKLMEIKGVGGKVADCILLFSLSRYEVFPKDVWIKRIMNEVYKVEERDVLAFAEKTFGRYGGFAQQYLFYYYRDNSKG